jgi:hypothetical protein
MTPRSSASNVTSSHDASAAASFSRRPAPGPGISTGYYVYYQSAVNNHILAPIRSHNHRKKMAIRVVQNLNENLIILVAVQMLVTVEMCEKRKRKAKTIHWARF